MRAYVLVQTEIRREPEVALAVAQIDGVLMVDPIAGPYDLIVRVEAESLEDLGRIVVDRFQEIDGLERTLTCPVVNL